MLLRNGKVTEVLLDTRVPSSCDRQKQDIDAILDLMESAKRNKDRILIIGRLYRYLNDLYSEYGVSPKHSVLGSKRVVEVAVIKATELLTYYQYMKPRHQAYFDKFARYDVAAFIQHSGVNW